MLFAAAHKSWQVHSWRKPTPHSKAHPLVNRPNLALMYHSSRSRRTAALAGFFDLSHTFDGPER